MRTFRPVLVILAALAFTTACTSSTSDDGSATGDDANLTELSSADVKVEGKAVDFGASRKYLASPKDKAHIHAVPFAGNVGDTVQAESHSSWAGTLYVLKQVGASYAVVGSEKVAAKKAGSLSVSLRTAGSFFVAFDATAPKTAAKTASTTVTLTLGGAAGGAASPPADSSFVGKLKSTYEEGNADQDFVAIDENKLPAAALKDWKSLNKTWGPDYPPTASTWKFQGKTVYVVENDNDGGMSVNFYDDTGKLLAGGSAGESEDFTWD
jgi:hypothetical protein